jgi:hypothetical protein
MTMTKVENNFYKYAIDSCKIRIKREQITIVNSDILDEKSKIIISNSSGEIFSEDKIKSFSTEIKFTEYKIRIALVSYFNFQTKIQEEFLEIYLHSKILESEYFEGIQKGNIRGIYDKLMNQKVFEVSYEVFVSSCVNDVDIKFDYKASKEGFGETNKELFNRSLESKKLEVGGKLWDNGNLTFNRRESCSISHPFVKLYNKELECGSKNAEFFEYYCDWNDIRQRRRIEVTIKKTAEIKKVFDVYESNLNSLLSLTQEQMRNYCVIAINKNLIQTCKVEKSAISNNNLDTLIHIHFSNSMNNQGQTFMQTLSSFLEHFEGDTKNKYRMKLKAKKWLENTQTIKEDINEEVQEILKILGVE